MELQCRRLRFGRKQKSLRRGKHEKGNSLRTFVGVDRCRSLRSSGSRAERDLGSNGIGYESTGTDGSGNWDLTTSNWYNPGTAMDVQWSNAVPYSAVFGNPTSTVASSDGHVKLCYAYSHQYQRSGYHSGHRDQRRHQRFLQHCSIRTDGSETLTLNGNLIKASAVGESLIRADQPDRSSPPAIMWWR